MENLLVVVTGASDGIGFVCAQSLAARGAQVILVGRDEEKCADAVATIRKSTDNGKLSFDVADLSQVRDSISSHFNPQQGILYRDVFRLCRPPTQVKHERLARCVLALRESFGRDRRERYDQSSVSTGCAA